MQNITENCTQELSYLKRKLKLKNMVKVFYLFELDNSTLPVYFGLKKKHDYLVINYNINVMNTE